MHISLRAEKAAITALGVAVLAVAGLTLLYLHKALPAKAGQVTNSLTITCDPITPKAILNWGTYSGANSNGVQRGHTPISASENSKYQCATYWCFMPNNGWLYTYTDTDLLPDITYEYRVKYTGVDYSNSVYCNTKLGTAPIVETYPATSMTAQGATLHGDVIPSGYATDAWFEYGTTQMMGSATVHQSIGSSTTDVTSLSVPIDGLNPLTQYYFRVVASNKEGTTPGSNYAFTTTSNVVTPSSTVGTAPKAVTRAAQNITQNAATLEAQVTPSGLNTTVWFEISGGGASRQSSQTSAGSGNSVSSVSIPISGLSPGTTYSFYVAASNLIGSSRGSALTFTTQSAASDTSSTPPLPKPTFTISPTAKSVMEGSSAQFTAWYDPDGPGSQQKQDVTADAVWSVVSGGAAASNQGKFIGTKTGTATLGAAYKDLSARATLNITKFQGVPFVKTLASSNRTPTSFSMNGAVNPNGLRASAWFEYGSTRSLGKSTAAKNVGDSTTPTQFTFSLYDLQAGVRLYYRIVAKNSIGTKHGAIINAQSDESATLVIVPTSSTPKIGDSLTFTALYDPDGAGSSSARDVSKDAIWISSANGIAMHKGGGIFMVLGSGDAELNVYYNPQGPISSLLDLENLNTSTTVHVASGGSGENIPKTGEAVDITTDSAVLNGSIPVSEEPLRIWFEYGQSDAFGSSTEQVTVDPAADRNVSTTITGLNSGSKYYFRIVTRKGFADLTGGQAAMFTTSSRTLQAVLIVLGVMILAAALVLGGYFAWRWYKGRGGFHEELPVHE
ncbi:MAG: fibronectin type III domain-containing protein [Candidatus Liptonbacteria bacterium]